MRKIIYAVFKSTTHFLKENKRTVMVLLVTSILVDIFFVKTSSDFIIFGVLSVYVFFTRIFRLKSKSTFLLCLGLLVSMFINFLLSGASVSTEKAAVWFILFLVVGIVMQWRE